MFLFRFEEKRFVNLERNSLREEDRIMGSHTFRLFKAPWYRICVGWQLAFLINSNTLCIHLMVRVLIQSVWKCVRQVCMGVWQITLSWLQVQTPQWLAGHVTSGKILYFHKYQFSHVQNEWNNNPCTVRFWGGLNEPMQINGLALV